jgi:3-oxoacyl-[acyl-carrier protein] reductase
MINYNLAGKAVIITGGTGGIGSSAVKKLLSSGAKIFATTTSEAKIAPAKQEISDFLLQHNLPDDYINNVQYYVANLANSTEVSTIVAKSQEFLGTLDVLICNAGITKDALSISITEESWNEVIQVNLNANFVLNRDAAKIMMKKRKGRIINISSIVGVMGNAGQANYVASKAGLIGLTKTMALEFAKRGVTANAIAPGFIKTSMTDILKDEVKTAIEEKIPMGRQGEADEIASVIAFLASDDSSYITGQTIHVNGGMYLV